MPKIIALPTLYPLQQEIENHPARFRVIACGRRWGKSFFAMREVFKMMWEGFKKERVRQRAWIVAPTFPLVREDWMLAEQILEDAITNKKETQMKMDFGAIGFLEFKSAERDDEGLRGAGLNACVIDESSRVSRKSWEMGIRPALSDKQGRCIFISTPKGRNWFYDIYNMGKQEDSEYKSWQHATNTNPYFPQSEWEIIKANTPEMVFKQEFMADFLENEATVFKNVDMCLKGSFEEYKQGEYYTMGLDLGRTNDFTVCVVIKNSTVQVVEIMRINKIDWAVQKEQIRAISARYHNPITYIDSTGLGDPIEDDLRRSGMNTKDYKFTNQSKEDLIEQLIVAIEQKLIGIPKCMQTDFLIDELKSFSYDILPSGKVRYSAPEGLHDDGVIALGLAVRGIAHLLYRQEKKSEPERKWGTADDWERFYHEMDVIKGNNPFLDKRQIQSRLISRKFRRIVSIYR